MINSRYITKDDYNERWGVDLSAELPSGDNESNKVERFLTLVEDRLACYVMQTTHKNIDLIFPRFTDYQKLEYKKALLEQAYYMIRNGDIGSDSGYDPNRGLVATNRTLKAIEISRPAIAHLEVCGLFDRRIAGNSWFKDFYGY